MPGWPRSTLVDAGPLVALIKADDANHSKAKRFAGQFTGSLITTWPVVAEAAYFLSQPGRRALIAMIQDGHLLVEELKVVDLDRMRALLAKFPTMDFADASLVSLGERLDLYDVITLDRRDFAIYRGRSGRAFVNRFHEAV